MAYRGKKMQTTSKTNFGTATFYSVGPAFAVWAAIIGLIVVI